MGFLSSLFGYSDKPVTESGSKVASIPPELKPFVEEALAGTRDLYRQRLAEGYTPFPGDTIAPLTPEEIASEQGLKSLVGTQLPFQTESLDLMRGAAREFTPEAAAKFASPHLRGVLDERKRQAQRQFERTKVPEFEAKAVDAGAMSGLGTRAAVESAERADLQNRLLESIEAEGLQKAYEDSQRGFQDQLARERTLGTDIATTGRNIFTAGIAEQGLLKDIGAEKREIGQSLLDEAYKKFIEKQQFPEQQLARYQSSIYGNPILSQPNYQTTGVKTPAQASPFKNLLGLGLGGIMAYGAGGGGTPGGWNIGQLGRVMSGVKAAGGGQVGGLSTLYRQAGGRASNEPDWGGDPDEESYEMEPDQQQWIENPEYQNFPTGQQKIRYPTGEGERQIKDILTDIRGRPIDNILAGLSRYLKPHGTFADIPEGVWTDKRAGEVRAGKEELKDIAAYRTAAAKAAAARSKGKYSFKDLDTDYKHILSNQVEGIQLLPNGNIIIDKSIYSGAGAEKLRRTLSLIKGKGHQLLGQGVDPDVIVQKMADMTQQALKIFDETPPE